MSYLLGLDLGTSAAKAVLFNEGCQTIASASCSYPLYQPQNGWAEQDPEDWWRAVVDTVQTVLGKSRINGSQIKGVGIAGQMHGLVMLDKNGMALRRSILWCDQRTSEECRQLTEMVGKDKLIKITANPALTGFTASKIIWVRNHQPEIYSKCAHILLPKDYIRFRLTGEFATDVSDASGMQLLDVPNRRWSNEILQDIGVDKSLLARVYESPEVTGQITKGAAKLTGLGEGTPVIGGAGDNAAAAVGTGVVQDGFAFTTIGTSGVVYAHTSNILIDPKNRVHTFCCAVPGCWHVMGVTQAAGLSLKWFRDNFCHEEKRTAEGMGEDPYYLMDQQAKNIPIGCNRLIYLPYLMGERTPYLDSDCRGVFFGLSAIHTKYAMLRSVMEGVAFSLRDCLEILLELGIESKAMIACGGGGKSKLWRKMIADIYGCPVSVPLTSEGPALGVAILAGVGVGIYPDVQQACNHLIKNDRPLIPNDDDAEKYKKIYQVYKELYPALKPIYKKLIDL